jgi:signal transduction histidine kinase
VKGQMIAGIAHEINNPISFIAGNLVYANQYTSELLEILRLYQEYCPQPGAEIFKRSQILSNSYFKCSCSTVIGCKSWYHCTV